MSQLPERAASDAVGIQLDAQPFELNTGASSSFVDIEKDRLTATYSGAGQHGTDVGAIQTSLPVPRQCFIFYFEMTVQNKGEKGRITLGFTVKDSKLSSQPG